MTDLRFHRSELEMNPSGNQRPPWFEEAPPCILERMHDAVIETKVANVIADHHINSFGEFDAMRMSPDEGRPFGPADAREGLPRHFNHGG